MIRIKQSCSQVLARAGIVAALLHLLHPIIHIILRAIGYPCP
jgi:hypothetical protein